MADSSDMAESEDDDVVSVTRLTEDTEKPQKLQRDRKLLDKDKENESKERVREKDLEKERDKEKVADKDKEQDEWDKFIGNEADKLLMVSSPRTSVGKSKKKNT